MPLHLGLSLNARSGWSPRRWSSLVSWFDPEDNATVFSDTGATTQAVAGTDTVAYWSDKLGRLPVSQATAGNRPTYITDAISGRRAVKFTAASSQRLATSGADVSSISGDDNPYSVVMALRRGSTIGTVPMSVHPTVTNYHEIRPIVVGGSTELASSRVQAGIFTNVVTTSYFGGDVWYVVTAVFSGTTMTLRINGVDAAVAGAMNIGSIALARMSLGAAFRADSATWNAHFDGALGETFISDDGAMNSNILIAEQRLMAKYGADGNLYTGGSFNSASDLSTLVDASTAPGTYDWVAPGHLRMTRSGGGNVRIDRQLTALTTGVTYRISLDLVQNPAGVTLFVGTAQGANGIGNFGISAGVTGTQSFDFTPTVTNPWFRIFTFADGVTLIDRVDVRRV